MKELLRAETVGKWFGQRKVLGSAYLSARESTITALVGRNGAGKSTLIRICAGWLEPDHGKVSFDGQAIPFSRPHLLAREGLCYLPSDPPLLSPSFTLRKQLEAAARQIGTDRLPHAVERLRLASLLDRKPHQLSGGERRRSSFALASLLAPRCLLTDEPFRDLAPLDADLLAAELRRLRAEGCAVVVTGHDIPRLFEDADLVVWVTDATTRAMGSPAEARNNWHFRRDFLGEISGRFRA